MLWGLSQWVKLHCKASPQHSFGKSTKPTSMYVLPMMIHFIMNFPHGYLPRYYLKCAVVSDSQRYDQSSFFGSTIRSRSFCLSGSTIRSDPFTLLWKGSTIRSFPILFDPFRSDHYRLYLRVWFHKSCIFGFSQGARLRDLCLTRLQDLTKLWFYLEMPILWQF